MNFSIFKPVQIYTYRLFVFIVTTMKIEKTNTLSKKQNAEILVLQNRIFQAENLSNKPFLSNELNIDKEIPCFFLLYEDNHLVSFLSCFVPSQKEAEINGFTDPVYRHRGYFSALLEEAKATLKPLKLSQFVLQIETCCQVGNAYGKKRCSSIERTEYQLSMQKEAWMPSNAIPTEAMQLRKATQENTEIYSQIAASAFEDSYEWCLNYVTFILSNPDREAFIMYRGEQAIGILNTHYITPVRSLLYGIAVTKELQGKGYGKQMLSMILTLLFDKGNLEVALEVDSDNPRALSLYLHQGFTICFQVDYHRLSV